MNELAQRRVVAPIRPTLHFFLTSKPYSYVQEISRGILLATMMGAASPWDSLWLPAALSLLMWLYFNWQSDRLQRNVGRIVPSRALCATPISVAILILIVDGRFLGILGVLFYALTILLYSQKAIRPSVGPYGPALRGLTTMGHFAMLSSALTAIPDIRTFYVACVLVGVHGSRNLVGDVRDIRTDEYEFPARFGSKATLWVLRGMFAASVALYLEAAKTERITVWPISVLIVSWILLELLAARFANVPALWGYFGHRMLVVMNTLLNLAILWTEGISLMVIALLVMLTAPLQLSYRFLPGKTFPPLSSLYRKLPQNICPD